MTPEEDRAQLVATWEKFSREARMAGFARGAVVVLLIAAAVWSGSLAVAAGGAGQRAEAAGGAFLSAALLFGVWRIYRDTFHRK